MQFKKIFLSALALTVPSVKGSGTYCSETLKLYSSGRGVTYGEIRLCILLGTGSGNDKNRIRLSVSKVQYKWGADWWNPNTNYKWDANVRGHISGVSGNYFAYVAGSDHPQGGGFGDLPREISGGLHNVSVHYYQRGPYWSDSIIDYKGFVNITLPSKKKVTSSITSATEVKPTAQAQLREGLKL